MFNCVAGCFIVEAFHRSYSFASDFAVCRQVNHSMDTLNVRYNRNFKLQNHRKAKKNMWELQSRRKTFGSIQFSTNQ